ncbi:BTB/POZ domain-containing protein At1g63850 [Aristolochia californica]|uniref:BTB/POZ domain-containing protein At1g63850 n=1 Tax=Aristolochia californica TaxID=171875 RepID=UPI0035D849FE
MAAMRLALEQGQMQRPSPLLNLIFMTTVNTAAKTLAAVSTASREGGKWKPIDHVRYMMMLTTWFTLWVLRVLMDHFPVFPCSVVPSPAALLDGLSPFSSSSSSLQLVLHDGRRAGPGPDAASGKAIGRALSHIFGLLNEISASSRKYQFAIAMADRIVDENALSGSDTLRDINRLALSAAFARTCSLLHRSLQTAYSHEDYQPVTLPCRVLHALPLGSHLVSYLRTACFFCLTNLFPSPKTERRLQRQVAGLGPAESGGEAPVSEKHAQELLWLANKMRGCGAVEEAVVQWSFASGLASLALTANARVQGAIVKISAILMREAARGEFETQKQLKFHLLALWLPLFCFASNGYTYPFLTCSEKTEMERVLEDLISALPPTDQEIILLNWLQDFTISSSEWPNLQRCYDRWCRSSRKLLL